MRRTLGGIGGQGSEQFINGAECDGVVGQQWVHTQQLHGRSRQEHCALCVVGLHIRRVRLQQPL